MSIQSLRNVYEDLAAKCSEAIAVGDKPTVAKLMAAKKKAHTDWHNAVVAERHAKRDAGKPKAQ